MMELMEKEQSLPPVSANEKPREDTLKRQPSANQKEGLTRLGLILDFHPPEL